MQKEIQMVFQAYKEWHNGVGLKENPKEKENCHH